MFLQLFSSIILHPIFISTISLIFLPNFQAQQIQQFSECLDQTFSCGKNIRNISYPFWGDNRPSYCGLRGFKLSCKDDVFATIEVNSLTFRVLSIDQSAHNLKIARTDIQDDTNICPPVVTSFLNETTLFGYNNRTEIIYLYYDCPFELKINLSNSLIWGDFTCTKNGDKNQGFYAGELFSADELEEFEACRTEMLATVARDGFMQFRKNATMTMGELLTEGFIVDYISDGTACTACVNSGGLCGSDFEDSRRFQCICRNRGYSFTCLSQGTLLVFVIILYYIL